MKRSFIYTVCFLLLSLAQLSCDDFLREKPRDRIFEEEAYKNLSDLYLNAVASLYNNIGGYSDSQGLQGTGRGIYDLNTFTTDEAIMPTRGGDWYDGGFWQGLYLHNWGVNNDAIQATWEYLYKVIGLSNKSLERIAQYAGTHNDRELVAYEAEVRALRALYYYHLVDLFGNVPLVLSSSMPVKEVKQSTRQEVYDFVVRELQQSAPELSTAHGNLPGTYYGRITRPVAHFLLAKLALNAEVYTDNDWTDGIRPDGRNIYFNVGGEELNAWQTVEAYCDSVTKSGYRLEEDYTTNFAVFNESSAENIFIIPMNKNLYTNQMQYLFRSRHYNHAKAYGLSGENGSSATIEVLKTFASALPLFTKGRHICIIRRFDFQTG